MSILESILEIDGRRKMQAWIDGCRKMQSSEDSRQKMQAWIDGCRKIQSSEDSRQSMVDAAVDRWVNIDDRDETIDTQFQWIQMSNNEDAAHVVMEERRWEALNPEILALIFVRIQPSDEMVRCVPFVCKRWMEVVAGPYCCWRDINLLPWSRRYKYDRLGCDAVAAEREVNLVVEKLVRRSSYTLQRLSVYYMGESGFLSVLNWGRCLKLLQIPDSRITDDMVINHIKPLPNLVGLDISFCREITSKGLAAFGNHCKSLVYLRRYKSPSWLLFGSIDESEAKTIAHTMPNLQRIELRFGEFGNSGLSEILTKCKSLIHLDIHGCWKVKLDGDLLEICERLGHFQSPGSYDDEDDPISSKDVDGDFD